MDPPPPLPPSANTIPTVPSAAHHYPDSQDSSVTSPTSRQWDDSLPPPKLRLMCSYGGHIIPRPHDKSLCYVGGDTRIVVADRHTSLSDLSSRLSRTLLHGRQFTLKYQLPNEDLDSLVSITTDEDLDNMIEEYDRLNSLNPSSKPFRLRLFLFLSKPETAASMGSLLDDAKSETWFVDALNGAGLLPRGLSDSAAAAIDNLLELEDGTVPDDRGNCTDVETLSNDLASKMVKNLVQEVQSSMPDSPMVETTSSFGSSSSSPSMANLPPIKVRADHMDQMAGLDEQLSHLNVGGAPPPPLPVSIMCGAPAVAADGGGSTEYSGRVVPDDERSDQGVPTGPRKPPLPLQPIQRKIGHDVYSLPSPDSKHGGTHNLHSPDSIASDSSIASANSLSRHAHYQEPNLGVNREPVAPPTAAQIYPTTTTMSDMNYQIPIQQVSDSVYPQPPPQQTQDQQQQQQQFYHIRPQYIHQPLPNQPLPMSSYYQVYAPPPSQQQMEHQQYPLYFLPVSQNQPYNLTMQSNVTDAATIGSSAATPPLYPTKTTTTLGKTEMGTSSVYRTATPGMIQVPTNQFQQQYVNVSRTALHPPTPMPPVASNGNYGYEYAHPSQDPVYYSQQHSVVAPLPSQYQTMTSAAAVLLTQASSAQQQAPETAKP